MDKTTEKNLVKLDNEIIRNISNELTENLSEELYNKLLLLKLETEVESIESGKMKKITLKKLKKLLD